jgi:hypothetical protein
MYKSCPFTELLAKLTSSSDRNLTSSQLLGNGAEFKFVMRAGKLSITFNCICFLG